MKGILQTSMFRYYFALTDEATGATGMYEILYLCVHHNADENCHVGLFMTLKQHTY